MAPNRIARWTYSASSNVVSINTFTSTNRWQIDWAAATTVNNEEPGDLERNAYSVTVKNTDGSTTDVSPFALGDLVDNDNNHELCLDTTDVPISVSFPAGYLTDPNNDLNPATKVEVIQR